MNNYFKDLHIFVLLNCPSEKILMKHTCEGKRVFITLSKEMWKRLDGMVVVGWKEVMRK